MEMKLTVRLFLSYSFYRSDAVLAATFDGDTEELAKYSIRVQLTPVGGDNVVAQWTCDRISEETKVSMDISGLPAGYYTCRVEVVDIGSGDVLALRELPLGILGGDSKRPRRVDIRDDNVLLVNGEPFFPIGIYSPTPTEAGLAEVAKAGFNLVCPPSSSPQEARRFLDLAGRYGLRVWIPIGELLYNAMLDKLQELISAVGDHPALLVWESLDEPAWNCHEPDPLIAGYRALKRLDQDHPLWTNHAPRNSIETLAYFNLGTDITGADIYPVPEPQRHSSLPNKTLSVVGDETKKLRETVCDKKPVWMVLQGFAWANLPGRKWRRLFQGEPIYPTFKQSRFMAYDAIINGANGVLYWGTNYAERPSQFWSDLKALASELALMSPVLVQRSPKQTVKVSSGNGSVILLQKYYRGDLFLICANEGSSETDATFTDVTLPSGEELRVLFEGGRRVRVQTGSFSDKFEGYDVRIYTTSGTFEDKRKDYSSEAAPQH